MIELAVVALKIAGGVLILGALVVICLSLILKDDDGPDSDPSEWMR